MDLIQAPVGLSNVVLSGIQRCKGDSEIFGSSRLVKETVEFLKGGPESPMSFFESRIWNESLPITLKDPLSKENRSVSIQCYVEHWNLPASFLKC